MKLEHLSYSGLHTYETCPEQYRLLKQEGLPDMPGVYHAGGTAVHAQCQQHNEMLMGVEPDQVYTWEESFEQAVLEQEESSGFPRDQWKVAGTKLEPETIDWWRRNGLAMVNRWKNWLRASAYTPWITPDGELAIELEVAPQFGEVQGKGIIDVVLQHASGSLGVVDIKTGKPPKTWVQLGTYAEAVQQRWPDVECTHGGYWLARGAILTGWHDLSGVMGAPLTYEYSQAATAIEHDIFPPRPSGLCSKWCSVRESCYSQSPGSAAALAVSPWRERE